MSQSKGKRYESDLIREIYDVSDEEVIPLPCGYSGNHVTPSPDILINDGTNAHAFEVKRIGDDRWSFDSDEIEQLMEFSQTYGPPTYAYLLVRFNHRRAVIVKLYVNDDSTLEDVVESGHTMCPVESKITRGGNLMVYKPDAEEWPSASESDAEYILDTIGYYKDARVRKFDIR